jgi:hypothetical protein
VYPRTAVYTGSGGTDDAANFKCRKPKQGNDRHDHDDRDRDDDD